MGVGGTSQVNKPIKKTANKDSSNSIPFTVNADLLFIPQPNFATIKRMPMFNFPSIWNEEGPAKNNPNQYIYLRIVKRLLFLSLI